MAKNINASLVAHLKRRLSEVDQKPEVKSEQKNDQPEGMSSGLNQLLGFFEEKLSDPEFASDELDFKRKKKMYSIFEQAVQKSLISTKKTQSYDDFPELVILYFLKDADDAGFEIEEIESVMQELK